MQLYELLQVYIYITSSFFCFKFKGNINRCPSMKRELVSACVGDSKKNRKISKLKQNGIKHKYNVGKFH